MGRDDETTRCPMCKDLMLPLILHEFIENGELYEQIWWTCRSSQKNKCDFPSMITPIDVFWVRRTQEEKFLNTIPPPNFMLLDRHWRYLYPGLFPADPLPSLDPSTLEVPQVRRRRRAIPPPSVASSSTYSSCSSSSSRNSTTSALSPVRQVLIDDSLYSSSIASSPLRQQMAGSSSPHSTGSDMRIEGMEPLMSDSMERLTGSKKVSRTQIGEDVRESTSHSRRVTALTGPRSSNTQGKIQRAPDDERITREIVTGMQSKGKDQLMTDEPIQFFNFVIAKRFVREDFLNELGSTVVKRKLQKHGRKELVQVALKGEDLNYDEIREVVVAPEKPFSELRHYDAEGLHTAISSTSSAYKRRAVAVVAPSPSPSLPVAPPKKSMKLLPEVKDLVREKMEKYKQFCEEERDKSTATGVAEDDRLRELAEFGEEPVAEESRVEEEETQSEVYDPIREHFEANAFQDPHFDPQFDYYGLDSM